MRFTTLLLGGTLLLAAAPAFAQSETDPPGPITVSGSATVVSDYRLRGVSQTDKHAALQASLTIAHESGFYISTFASNLAGWGTFGGANLELDAIGGYKHDFDGTTLDGGVTWYTYPGGFSESDVVEFYARASRTLGPASATVGVAYAPNQTSLGRIYNNAAAYAAGTPTNPKRWDNLYLSGDIAVGVPTTPVTVKGHLGYSKGNPGLGPNGTSLSPTGKYLDYSVGADVAFLQKLTLNVSFVGTDIGRAESAYLAPNFRESTDGSSISKGRIVAGVTVAF
jgi:uncharacterized protein (TIGR02001 family)